MNQPEPNVVMILQLSDRNPISSFATTIETSHRARDKAPRICNREFDPTTPISSNKGSSKAIRNRNRINPVRRNNNHHR